MHTLDALAWTLIHFCWQALAVAVLYRALLARSASQTRYALSVAAMALMALVAIAMF